MKKVLVLVIVAVACLMPSAAVAQHWIDNGVPSAISWPTSPFSGPNMKGGSLSSPGIDDRMFLDMNALLRHSNFSLLTSPIDPVTLGLVAKGEATEFVVMEFVDFLAKQTNSPLLRFVPLNMMLVDFAFDARDIVRVHRGLAPPEDLPIIASHLVMANQVLRGPENIPGLRSEPRTEPINTTWNDHALRMTTTGTHTVHTMFYSTASPFVARYGFDPATDRIFRTMSMRTTTSYYSNGADFNRWWTQYGSP